ncbi:TPA: hypothetical protein ACH3X1_001997 [Trebouxia sp. C0004]
MPAESDAPSSVGSDAASTNSSDQGDAVPALAGDDDRTDLLKNQTSLQDSVFGVLFTITKEKLNNSWKYAMTVIILDVLQLLVFNLEDGFPWTFEKTNWEYHLFTDFQLQRLALRGGELVYMIFFWLLTAIVVVSAALCVFVAYNFRTNNFPYIWPIKLLRFTVSIFFEMLYISSLAMFSVSFDCKVIHVDTPYWMPFPADECFKLPVIIMAIVGAIMLLISASISFLQSVAATELDPDSRDLLALAHASPSIQMWVLKTIVTVLGEIIATYHKLQGILLLLINLGLLWIVVRNVPYYNAAINCFQGALYTLLTWQALILFALVWDDSWAEVATYIMLIGQPFALAAGVAVVWTRLFYAERIARRFKDAKAAGVLKVRHRFCDAHEVEICARCARKKDPDHEPIMAWVDAADMMYSTGLEQYPESVFLHIAYANFLSTYKKSSATQMATHLAIARKCNPAFSERFNLFVKQREHSQASESDNSGEGAKDLVSIVEFQTSLKLVLQAHSNTLRDIRGFWRELCSKKTTFVSLSEAFTQMHQSETRAEETYKVVILKYPKSVKILRAYVHFLREIKNDPWKAQKYDLQADNYEQAQMEAAKDAAFAANIGVGGGDLSNLLSEDNPDGVVMITEEGKITFVNKKVQAMFGYTHPELEGKNVAMLMPPPFSMQHHTFLRSYKQTQKGNLLGTGPREVIALHKDGYVFPVKVVIEKSVDAEGYTGVFHEVQEDPRAGIAWVSGEGQLYCVSKGFMALLGYSFHDMRRNIQSIGANDELEKQMVIANANCSEFFATMKRDKQKALTSPPFEFEVPMKHKYGATVMCKISIKFSGAEDLRLLSCTITFAGENARMGLMTADVSGKIIYANVMFETALHYPIGSLANQRNISELLAPPYTGMHSKWVQAALRPKTLPMAPTSCRNGKVVVLIGHRGRDVPVKLNVTLGDLLGHRVWNAAVEPLEVPIGVSGGGFGSLRIPNLVAKTKRLRLMVRGDGIILGASADNAWALHALGVDPTKIIHQSMAQYVDVFADVGRALPAGRLTPTLVTDEGRIASKTVGVIAGLMEKLQTHCSVTLGTQHGPTSWSALWGFPQSGRDTGGKPTLVPILIELPDMAEEEIDVQEACDAGLVDREDLVDELTHVEYAVYTLDIWRTDILDAIMEVDGNCNVKQANNDASTMFGFPVAGLKTLNLSRLFHLADVVPKGGQHAGKLRVEDFLEIKKTQLKGAKAEAVTDKKKVNGQHSDGAPLVCTVQGMDKHGDGLRYLLRVTASVTEASGNLERILANALSVQPSVGLDRQPSRRPGAPADTNEATAEVDAKVPQDAAEIEPVAPEEEEEEIKANVKADQSSVADSTASGNKMDDKRHEEFARAKQFRKLNKLLNTPAAKRPITQFRNFAIAVLTFLVIIQVITFVVDRILLKQLNTVIQSSSSTITAGTYAVQVNYASTVLWATLDANAPAAWNTYGPDIIALITDQFSALLLEGVTGLNGILTDAFLNPVSGEVFDLFRPGTSTDYYETRYIDVEPTPYSVTERSALEKTQAIFVRSAYQIYQLPAAHKHNLSYWEPYRFVDDNTLPIVLPAILEFVAMVLQHATTGFHTNQRLILVLLILYAIAIMSFLILLMMLLVRRAASSRLRLFSIFTSLPRPTVMALANQSIDVSGGTQDEEDEEAWQQANTDPNDKKQSKDAGPAELPSSSEVDADQVHKGLGSKTVNYSLSNKRELKGMGYGMYLLVLPFFAWMIVLVAVYADAYVAIAANLGPASSGVGMNELNRYNLLTSLASQRLVLSQTAEGKAEQHAQLIQNAELLTGTLQTILFAASGHTSGVLHDEFARHLLLDPVCLRQDPANCRAASDQYYVAMTQGLEAAINTYAQNALALAAEPLSALGINNTYLQLIARCGPYEIREGIETLANHLVGKAEAVNTQLMTIEVVVLIVLLVLVPLYYWYMLQPFYKRLGKESRRVAELLSQLPKSIDVQGMVADAMAVQLPSSKASSVPASPTVSTKRSFWPAFLGRRRSAYKGLKDVDKHVKKKDSNAAGTDENSDDVPLLKAGDPTGAKYAEKLKRHSEKDELFVPRPNSRITFKLPNSTPSEDMQPESMPRETIPTDIRAPDDAAISPTDNLIPASDLLAASDTAPASDVSPSKEMAAASDAVRAVEPTTLI